MVFEKVNLLLKRVGLNEICLESVQECVPSVWVAIAEGLLNERIPGIQRPEEPQSSPDYKIDNMSVLLSWLSEIFQIDISHIKPVNLVLSDSKTVYFMAEIFEALMHVVDEDEIFNDDISSISPKSIGNRSLITIEDSSTSSKRKRKLRARGPEVSISLAKDDIQEFIDQQDMKLSSIHSEQMSNSSNLSFQVRRETGGKSREGVIGSSGAQSNSELRERKKVRLDPSSILKQSNKNLVKEIGTLNAKKDRKSVYFNAIAPMKREFQATNSILKV